MAIERPMPEDEPVTSAQFALYDLLRFFVLNSDRNRCGTRYPRKMATQA